MQKNFYKDNVIEYWRNVDKKIFFIFLSLFLLGLFFSLSSTSTLAGERLDKDNYFFFSKHLFFTTLSILLMIGISFINLNIIKKIVVPLFIIFLILLILVPFVGIEVKGAKRWLNFYLFRLQPIEIVKPLFILFTAQILTFKNNINSLLYYFISFAVLLLIILLLINQPDLGQTMLLIAAWATIIFLSGVSFFFIFSIFFLMISSILTLILTMPTKFGYITQRLKTFFDPQKGDSFQSDKALEAIRQGGIKGQGMGEGILKDSVPEAHTDYIIAVITEEFGSFISILIVGLFLYLAFRVIKTCVLEKDDNLKISLLGLITLLIYQTFIHVGVNTSLLPTTGMTLPFLSYGGSSLIGSAISAGIILNITKNRYLDNE
jgi:cell division protein FtsW